MGVIRTAWDRLSLYLPVLLMGLLALGTYWLARSTPLLTAPAPQAPARHEPDYFMRQFSIKSFDPSGRLSSELVGAEARHFPDTDTLEIDRVRIRAFNDEGSLTTASAQRAVTNHDNSEVQLFGDARVVRESAPNVGAQLQPRLEFRGEFLHAFRHTQRVTSDKPVTLTRGNDRFTADAMDYDKPAGVIELKGRVKGTLMPTVAK
jgi:lipopolysaccharide export system protein LptC